LSFDMRAGTQSRASGTAGGGGALGLADVGVGDCVTDIVVVGADAAA